MSRFYCVCGVVTREGEEPPGASLAVYAIGELGEIEARIALRIAEFIAAKASGNRAEWIESNFENGRLYPADESDRGVIEDIISGGLNERFTPMFRCPACGRIAMRDAEAGPWVFYSPGRNEGHD